MVWSGPVRCARGTIDGRVDPGDAGWGHAVRWRPARPSRLGARRGALGHRRWPVHGGSRLRSDHPPTRCVVVRDERSNQWLPGALSKVFRDWDIAAVTSDDLGREYPAMQYGPQKVDDTINPIVGSATRFEDLELKRVLAGPVTTRPHTSVLAAHLPHLTDPSTQPHPRIRVRRRTRRLCVSRARRCLRSVRT